MDIISQARKNLVTGRPNQRQHGCRYYAGRGLLGLIVVVIALAALGFVYQRIGETNDKQFYPAPGERVDVGGYSLHIHCMGEGQPTVILEAGTGESSLDWSLVQPDIAETTRVCAYDRDGYGWSDDGPHSRTSPQVAADLHTLLTNAYVEEPYVLVGHSVGTFHNQAYIEQYPDEVVGVVMVDSPTAEYFMTPDLSDEAVAVQSIGVDSTQLTILRLLSTMGVVRATNFVTVVDPVINDLPPDLQRLYLASLNQTQYFASLREEWEFYPANLRYAVALPPFSSNLPLVILIRDPKTRSGPLASAFYDDQMAYAARWPDAPVVIAEGSDHFITVHRPDLVIQAVQDVFAAVRTGEPLTP